jgi:hypothetical protein
MQMLMVKKHTAPAEPDGHDDDTRAQLAALTAIDEMLEAERQKLSAKDMGSEEADLQDAEVETAPDEDLEKPVGGASTSPTAELVERLLRQGV